jgi:hypothetical protein
MATKRRRKARQRTPALTPEEKQWLTGEAAAGASALWRFIDPRGDQAARCRELIRTYPHLIPPGHMAELKRDIELWTPPVPRGLSSFTQ